MQPSDKPHHDAEKLYSENDPDTNRETLENLVSRSEQLKKDFLQAADDQLFDNSTDSIRHTLTAARTALDRCQNMRNELRTAQEQETHFSSTWAEIQRRRKFLLKLQAALLDIRQLNDIAHNVVDAKNKRDHDTMSKACVVFEQLNSKASSRLDDTYKCLHGISERVSHAVVDSMRMLRTSLRAVCRDFQPSEYQKCMRSFDDLGALSHFSSHMLQVFDEEAVKLYQSTAEQEGKASQILIAFSADLLDLLSQFATLISFHVNGPEDSDESEIDRELRHQVGSSLRSKRDPFRRLAELSGKAIDEYRFSLIFEQTTTLLGVFESFNYLCDTAITAGSLLFEHRDDAPFRSKQNPATRINTPSSGQGLTLRRARAPSGLEEISLTSESSRLERRAWRSELKNPVSKALMELANDRLRVSHARHAEELSVITEVPECWVRIQMSEVSIQQMLEDVLGGAEGRILKAFETSVGAPSPYSQTGLGTEIFETNPSAWTLTTASISVFRWMSEYITIGIAEPQALSESLRSVIDLFLMFMHTSIDMKSRMQVSETNLWFKALEDVLLERPQTKTIGDFMSPNMLRMFQTFLNRYDSSMAPNHGDNRSFERWGCESNIKLLHYREAVGTTFSNAFTSHEAIIRQCVAAEGIGTLCVIMEKFFQCVETFVSGRKHLSEAFEVERMASLRASLLLGKAVQESFYKLLAWDIIGGWDAISAVAETYRMFHSPSHTQREMTATNSSNYINTLVQRIQVCYLDSNIPPQAAEEMGMVICSTAMSVLLEGFACVRRIGFASAASQALVDVRTLEMTLVELTGIHPCPGRSRTEVYVKASFLTGNDLDAWIELNRRRLDLHERHVRALQHEEETLEVPIVDQIITP